MEPITTPEPMETPAPSPTAAVEVPTDLHSADLLLEQQNTNGLLMFLIALICGVVFMQNFMKGWVK